MHQNSRQHHLNRSVYSKAKLSIMNRFLPLLFVWLLLPLSIFAKPVDENTAKQVASHFFHDRAGHNAGNLVRVTLGRDSLNPKNAFPTIYAFNSSLGRGFILIAADDCVWPVLGYSAQGQLKEGYLPFTVSKWLEGYQKEIRLAVSQKLTATSDIAAEWQQLITGTTNSELTRTTAVSPLVQTTWDQSPYYNGLCPSDNRAGSSNGNRCVAGCPATAMAQIMKFWNYPTKGTGYHSYNHQTYGTLSANFGATTYNWGSMPNNVSSSNTAVATLMYHCGVAVEMEYGPTSSGSYVVIDRSPAPEQCSEYAYETYFGYDPATVRGVLRENYTSTSWQTLMKTELDAGRPVQYAGFGAGAGHTFVCDGYDNSNLFHMNWGWGGYADGYFLLASLNPGGGGIGSGTGSYNQGQQAVIGIKPRTAVVNNYNLTLYDYLTPSASTINYSAPFTVSTNVWNQGTGSFTGDYAVGAFDANGSFVTYIATLSNYTLGAGNVYNSDLVFSNAGSTAMVPGTYTLGLYFKPTGGNYQLVSNYSPYTNSASITVVNSGTIELNAAIVNNNGLFLTEGEPASFTLNVVNDGASTFIGDYSIDLYDLEGNWLEEIAVISETSGLESGFSYLSPYLTFSTSAITSPPGSYLLAVSFLPDGGDWTLAGSSYYDNPINITVQSPAAFEDPYESNDIEQDAYVIPYSFSSGFTEENTAGSTCHDGEDLDYYKIYLEFGYDYVLNPRIQDSYDNSDNGDYTLDAQFSWKVDNNPWSDSYDDIPFEDIVVYDGGVVTIFVSPYFIGQSGSYRLDVEMNRTIASPTRGANQASLLTVKPNPNNGTFNVDLSKIKGKIDRVSLCQADGTLVQEMNVTDQSQELSWNQSGLPAGLYLLQVQSTDGVEIIKVSVQ
jgi:hypothetical protein